MSRLCVSSLTYCNKPGDCTTSSDDEFGCNIPLLLEEAREEEAAQNATLHDPPPSGTSGTDKSEVKPAPLEQEDPYSIISWLDRATKKPEPTATRQA
jgi:hypothetical protein